MSLRSYFAYGNVAPVQPLLYIDALGVIGSSGVQEAIAFPCNLVNMDGYAAAAGWFQIFDKVTVPTAGAVPIKTIYISEAGPLPTLLSSIAPVSINNALWCAMSSTEGTYTAVATSFDVWGEIEQFESQVSGGTVAGDLTTGVDIVTLWTNAQGPKQLCRVDVINGTGAAAWLMIFAKPAVSIANGEEAILTIPLSSAATTQTKFFGADGIDIYSQDSDLTKRRACAVAVSTTGTSLTLKGDTSSKIRGIFI